MPLSLLSRAGLLIPAHHANQSRDLSCSMERPPVLDPVVFIFSRPLIQDHGSSNHALLAVLIAFRNIRTANPEQVHHGAGSARSPSYNHRHSGGKHGAASSARRPRGSRPSCGSDWPATSCPGLVDYCYLRPPRGNLRFHLFRLPADSTLFFLLVTIGTASAHHTPIALGRCETASWTRSRA